MHKSCNKSPRRKSNKTKSRRRSRRRLTETQFYCVGCNKVCSVDNICVKTLKNGTPALYGKCLQCAGCKVYKFIKSKSKKRLTKKYGKCK